MKEGAQPQLVVPPEPKVVASPVSPWGQGGRAPFAISASGDTLGSPVNLDGASVVRSDIIDVPSLTVRATVPAYVCGVSDVAAIVCDDGAVVGVDIKSNATLWRADLGGETSASDAGAPFIAAVLVFDSAGIVEYSRDGELVISSVDLTNGSIRDLLVQGGSETTEPLLFLAPSISSQDHLVLLPEVGIGPTLDLAKGKAQATVLDTDASALMQEKFEIGAP